MLTESVDMESNCRVKEEKMLDSKQTKNWDREGDQKQSSPMVTITGPPCVDDEASDNLKLNRSGRDEDEVELWGNLVDDESLASTDIRTTAMR